MSYNKSLFEGVPKKNVNKTRFNLSHEYKCMLQPGHLVPILTLDTLPGDSFTLDAEFMFRFEPMYFPIMHKMTMRADWFYVPNRILWPYQGESNKGWKRWINEETEEAHPVQSLDLGRNTVNFQHLIGMYMGLPLLAGGVGHDTTIDNINAFPMSAYLAIYDEYYRIPQLEEERWFPLVPGDNSAAFQAAINPGGSTNVLNVLSAKWEMDYFTSALPTPQIGEAVQIPMTNEDGTLPAIWKDIATGNPAADGDLAINSGGPMGAGGSATGTQFVELDVQTNAATIKQLRVAEVLQSYYERIMKVGQRYRDFIKGLWGHDPEPMAVDVPVMIGSKFGRVQIADVMTQATDVASSPTASSTTGDYTGQANLYAADRKEMRYECKEHGWLMCILQVNANTSYGEGVHRMWRRSVQTDYPLDMFASIGDQEILKEEILYNTLSANAALNQDTFGYIPRFSEMRYRNNIHIGQLNFTDGLSMHLGTRFGQDYMTALNYDFIEISEGMTSSGPGYLNGQRIQDVFRVLPSATNPDFPTQGTIFAHIFHSIWVNRQLPLFSTPKLT